MDDALLLTALLSSPALALVGVDLDGTIDRWSPGAAELFGWPARDAVGQPLSVLAPEELVDELDSLRAAVAAGEERHQLETVRVAADRTRIPVHAHALAVRGRDGVPVGTLALYSDLRRARRAEAALSSSQDELRARFADSPVAQSRVGLDGTVLAVNAAMEHLLGRPADEIVGTSALSYYAEADRRGLARALLRLASGAESHVQLEKDLLCGDGSYRQVVTTVTSVRDESGGLLLAGAVEDVTSLREAEAHVREQAGRFDALLQSLPVAVFSYDRDGRCTSSRGSGLARLGLEEGQLVGTSLLELYEGTPQVVEGMTATLAGQDGHAIIDDADRVWEAHYRPLRGRAGEVVGGIGIAVDITERARAERAVRASEARLHALLREADDVALVVDVQGRLLYVSPAVTRVLGHDDHDLFWRPAVELCHPDDRADFARAWRDVVGTEGATTRFTSRAQHADGSWRWCEHVLSNRIADPDVGGMVVNLRDVTAHRRAEQEVQRLALHDGLTGLANRALLLDRAGQALTWASRDGHQTGLIALGITNLGAVNETFGHDVGDDVLRAVAGRMQQAAKQTDSVARLTGCHFCVLVEDVASTEDLRVRASTLLEAVRGPVEVRGLLVEVEARVASARTPAADASALLSAAERALEDALTAPPGVTILRSAAGSDGPDRSAVQELHRAVRDGELRLHFQPVMALPDGSLAGVEALVRWQHPSRGLLPPSEFIPLAEESGLIVDVGAWVLREACTHAATWQAGGHAFGVGVNLSPRQMAGGGLVELVRDVLRDTGARGDRLVLEVTESALMDDPGAADVLSDLRSMGVRLALDDFGTGYSSLTYLKRFPVDAIKIDRSFVSGLGRDPDDDAIVASVVSLGRAVGKILVAEGVETVEQLRALRALGVDQAQGYFWSPALPGDALLAWNDARRPYAEPAPALVRPAEGVPADEATAERILALHLEGASLHTIAAALNADGLRTAAGPRWTTTTVARVVARLSRTG